jgi:hypothetical protein
MSVIFTHKIYISSKPSAASVHTAEGTMGESVSGVLFKHKMHGNSGRSQLVSHRNPLFLMRSVLGQDTNDYLTLPTVPSEVRIQWSQTVAWTV